MSEQRASKVEMHLQMGSSRRPASTLPSTPIDKCVWEISKFMGEEQLPFGLKTIANPLICNPWLKDVALTICV